VPVALLLTSSVASRTANASAVFVLTAVAFTIAYGTALGLMVGSKVYLIYVKGVATQGERSVANGVVVQRGASTPHVEMGSPEPPKPQIAKEDAVTAL
jgi:hypothetical protein